MMPTTKLAIRSARGPCKVYIPTMSITSIVYMIFGLYWIPRSDNGTMEDSKVSDEAQIRALIEQRVQAIRDKDINRAMFNISRDILSFDVVNPLQYIGLDSLRRRAEQWFSSFEGPIGFEVRDLNIVTGGDVAFSDSLNRVSATKKDAQKLEMWWRASACYRKIDGIWTVIHKHNSVPFDPETGRASLNLKP